MSLSEGLLWGAPAADGVLPAGLDALLGEVQGPLAVQLGELGLDHGLHRRALPRGLAVEGAGHKPVRVLRALFMFICLCMVHWFFCCVLMFSLSIYVISGSCGHFGLPPASTNMAPCLFMGLTRPGSYLKGMKSPKTKAAPWEN